MPVRSDKVPSDGARNRLQHQPTVRLYDHGLSHYAIEAVSYAPIMLNYIVAHNFEIL